LLEDSGNAFDGVKGDSVLAVRVYPFVWEIWQ